MRFQDRSAIITGGSEGIGFAIAEALVHEGARVVIVARSADKLAEAVRKLGPSASSVAGDVADPATAKRAVAAAVQRHGALDLLVNNAGVLAPGMIATQSIEDVDLMLGLNLRGVFAFTQAAVAPLTGRKGASVLIISSVASRAYSPEMSMYAATKAALEHLTVDWAIELASAGIRVNSLSPGIVDTPALQAAAAVIPNLIEQFLSHAVIKRLGTPEEIARVALMMLDEHTCGFVTGANWEVGGGAHRV